MRIIVVEDDLMLQNNICLLLSGEPGVKVVGSYTNAADALNELKSVCPTIMLTDIGLPGMSGIELIIKAKEINPDLEIMAYTVFDDRDNLFSALKAGASGYILKGCKPRELIEAIYNLHEGGAPMSPQIARKVIREFHVASIEEQFLLTHREKDILSFIEKGMSYKELASHLSISVHTVHTHITKIYEKLRATGRKDALIKARRKGIL
jgi:two-component system NarL family response regulator